MSNCMLSTTAVVAKRSIVIFDALVELEIHHGSPQMASMVP
jgi:hypothetical protein